MSTIDVERLHKHLEDGFRYRRSGATFAKCLEMIQQSEAAMNAMANPLKTLLVCGTQSHARSAASVLVSVAEMYGCDGLEFQRIKELEFLAFGSKITIDSLGSLKQIGQHPDLEIQDD